MSIQHPFDLAVSELHVLNLHFKESIRLTRLEIVTKPLPIEGFSASNQLEKDGGYISYRSELEHKTKTQARV